MVTSFENVDNSNVKASNLVTSSAQLLAVSLTYLPHILCGSCGTQAGPELLVVTLSILSQIILIILWCTFAYPY